VRFEIKDLRINFSKTGEIVWWSAMLYDVNEWDGKTQVRRIRSEQEFLRREMRDGL
jgi:hypothetical protein